MMTSNSMQITTEVNTLTVCYSAPLSYCDSSVSNTTVGDVPDQGVVMMGCRGNGDHPERSTEWTGAPVLDQPLQSV